MSAAIPILPFVHKHLRALKTRVLRRRSTRIVVALIVVAMIATAFGWARGRAASNGFHWPVTLTRIFGSRTARTVSPLVPVDTAGDYRSTVSGNWNDIATWETFNGTTWVAASETPTSADGVITIRDPHTVPGTADVSADQLTIDAGGTLVVSSGVPLTIDNGAGPDLTVNGTATNGGTLTLAANSLMNVGGSFTSSGTFNPGTSTVDYNGSGAQ